MSLHFLTLIDIFTKFDALKILFHVILWGLQSELCVKNETTLSNKFSSAAPNFPKSDMVWCYSGLKIGECNLKSYNSRPKICPVVLIQSTRAKIQELNSRLFNHLHQTKSQKLQQLIGPQITNDTTLHSHNTVVTIPDNLPLTDWEKSVLSNAPMNFLLSKMSKNSFAAFNSKPFSMTKNMIPTLRTKIFLKHFKFANQNGLPQRDNLPP